MTITLDEALKAIQRFISTQRGQELNSLVIVASTGKVSPVVTSFNWEKESKTFDLDSLGPLYANRLTNPSWTPKQYEQILFPSPVVKSEPEPEKPVLPFHQRYKVGDQFRIVNSDSKFLNNFYAPVCVGDTLTIEEVDRDDPKCPYEVYLDKGYSQDFNWGEDNQFEQCVDSGDFVFIDVASVQYNSITLGGVTFNLVPQ